MRLGLYLAALLSFAGIAQAADVALVIGNSDYQRLRDVQRGNIVIGATRELSDEGVLVLARQNTRRAEMLSLLRQFAQASSNADGLIVVLSGRFIYSSTETYFLPIDSNGPALAEASNGGLPLSVIEAILASAPGRAVLVLASDNNTRRLSPYLSQGIGQVDPPQGVSVLIGGPLAAAEFINAALAVPGADLGAEAGRIGGLRMLGYQPKGHSFLQEPQSAPVTAPSSDPSADEEVGYWEAVRDLDTAEAYDSYVRRYPRGIYVAEARKAVQDIRDEPLRAARLSEEALGLGRPERREIQRNLTLLEHNTRGIDGIFGRGTRSAIAAWQEENGLGVTGYLTRAQITVIETQARQRAAELEAEAERVRLDQERDDRAYWRATGAAGDEAGFRAYLKRFPDGRYAEIANARLEAIEGEKRGTAAGRDRLAWDRAVAVNTAEAYRAYLTSNPNGAFVNEAKVRINDFANDAGNAQLLRQAKAVEDGLRLSPGTRKLIEQRLNILGLKPGTVDGTFDDRTRRSIRRFQSERNLQVTGFLNESAIVRIMAESILR